MYERSAQYYDILSDDSRNIEWEVQEVLAGVRQLQQPDGSSLLDVACGAGRFIGYWQEHYQVEGLDLSSEMLKIARQKQPDVTFHQADMLDFDLDRRFDVIVCLGSAIAYFHPIERMSRALATMARHLNPGGVLAVESWFKPEQYQPGRVFARFVDNPDLKVAWMNVNRVEGRLSILNFHFMVGSPGGIESFTERQELWLYTHEEYLDAFRQAGLDVTFTGESPNNRGLYFGVKGDSA